MRAIKELREIALELGQEEASYYIANAMQLKEERTELAADYLSTTLKRIANKETPEDNQWLRILRDAAEKYRIYQYVQYGDLYESNLELKKGLKA